MKYLSIVLTFIAILLALLVVKVYIIPDSNFEHVKATTISKEKKGDEMFLEKKSGCLYAYSPKYLAYPATIEEINLKTGKRKAFFIKP